MKTDTNDIDKHHLAQVLSEQYSLELTTFTFLPRGEDAYTYSASSQDGQFYFIRAQPPSRDRALEQPYVATHVLHTRYGMTQVVAPYPNRQQVFTTNYNGYAVAVFPFIEGRTLYSQGASNSDIEGAAHLLANVHEASDLLDAAPLKTETFENPFKSPILRALERAGEYIPDENSYRREAGKLLMAEYADVLATLERMEQAKRQVPLLTTEWVLTHGDPNLDNFLKDVAGVLHLADWGEIAIGPAERDLVAFSGEQFEVFLSYYIKSRSRKHINLHADIFKFYLYRWAMQEIADYSTRILLQNMGPQEDEHAWKELQDYLPIRHHDIEREVQELQTTVQRILG
jgi:thiamine kinase-like enzyme